MNPARLVDKGNSYEEDDGKRFQENVSASACAMFTIEFCMHTTLCCQN